MKSPVLESVPLGLDQHEEEKVVCFRRKSDNKVHGQRRGNAWVAIVAQASDESALIAWQRDKGSIPLGDLFIEATTLSHLCERARFWQSNGGDGKKFAGFWFPISGEVIPL